MSTTANTNAQRFVQATDDRTAVIDTGFSTTTTPCLMKVLCRALVEEDAEFVARATSAHDQLVAALKLQKRDHQRSHPHHAHLCATCIVTEAALAAAGAA